MGREGGVRLRPRAAASAAGASAYGAPSDNVRQTRAATKRSAVDDAKSTVLHPRKRAVLPPGRRAPLTDISKQVNAALSGCHSLAPLPDLKELKSKHTVEGDENALPEIGEALCAGKGESREAPFDEEEESVSEPESSSSSAIASLERPSVQTVTKESKDRVKKGDLFDDRDSETSSWSNGLAFKDIDTDHSDPQMCSTYAADIYMHLRMAEVSLSPGQSA